MRYRMHIFLIAVLFIQVQIVFAQDDSSKPAPKILMAGYIKYLQQGSFADNSGLATEELIHNRLNFHYTPNDQFKIRLEMRNRLYYGDISKNTPGFDSLVTAENGFLNLSHNWINHNGTLFNTTIDRASVEYNQGKWDITAGRQRINWGINTVWTPNDIFNTFNYFDFDYEERPGTDAARVQYNMNGASSIELAVSPGKTASKNVAALMYHLNKWEYDFQFFTGIYQQNITAGLGWAGNIKEAGFKGEISWFSPFRQNPDIQSLVASLSFDYGFKNGIYLLVSGLYNNNGSDSIPNLVALTSASLSAKNIFPFKKTICTEISYPFSPICKGSLALMYSNSGNAIILYPTLTFSLGNNWVADAIAQSFFASENGNYKALGNSMYLRVKWVF